MSANRTRSTAWSRNRSSTAALAVAGQGSGCDPVPARYVGTVISIGRRCPGNVDRSHRRASCCASRLGPAGGGSDQLCLRLRRLLRQVVHLATRAPFAWLIQASWWIVWVPEPCTEYENTRRLIIEAT